MYQVSGEPPRGPGNRPTGDRDGEPAGDGGRPSGDGSGGERGDGSGDGDGDARAGEVDEGARRIGGEISPRRSQIASDRAARPPIAIAGPPIAGRRIGRYVIGRRLGGGDRRDVGVWLAEHGLVPRPPLVVKVLDRAEGAAGAGARFRRAALALAALGRERVVRPIEAAAFPDGTPYLLLEHAGGRDLRSLLAAEGPLAVRRALELCRQAADTLDRATRVGIARGPLALDHVLVTGHPERVVLAGFDTPPSPRPPDARAEAVRALGAVLYTLLAGVPPAPAPPPPSRLRPPGLDRVPDFLDAWVERALGEPTARPRLSAFAPALGDMIAWLDVGRAARRDLPALTPPAPDTRVDRGEPTARVLGAGPLRSRELVLLLLMALLGMAAGLGIGLARRGAAPAAPPADTATPPAPSAGGARAPATDRSTPPPPTPPPSDRPAAAAP